MLSAKHEDNTQRSFGRQKQAPDEALQDWMADVEAAIATGRAGKVHEAIGQGDALTGDKFGAALVTFLRAIIQLPTDDPRCQSWSALYSRGNELRGRALSILSQNRPGATPA